MSSNESAESADATEQSYDDEVTAELTRGDWGKVVNALHEVAEMREFGDHIDQREGERFERLAVDLEDQTDAC